MFDGLDRGGVFLEIRFLVADLVEDFGFAGVEELAHRVLAAADVFHRHVVEVTVLHRKEVDRLHLHREWGVLVLFEELRSSFVVPATDLMVLVWAAEPTRETERPTEIAGRIP